ncbi:TetR family transcriptional regulator [Macrococcus hajekii]|nr:TetR family transcriptional regulator [Macrococcus hajekii]
MIHGKIYDYVTLLKRAVMREKQTLIEEKFIALLEVHRFRKITIKMICEEAQINRSTFYSYFQDKYDLLDRLIDHHLSELDQLVSEIAAGINRQSDRRELSSIYLQNLFQYLYEHKIFFKTLMIVHPAQNFNQKLIQLLRNNYMKVVENVKMQNAEYFVNYTLGGQFGIIFFWLQNDCQEPPDVIADIVYRNIIKTNR